MSSRLSSELPEETGSRCREHLDALRRSTRVLHARLDRDRTRGGIKGRTERARGEGAALPPTASSQLFVARSWKLVGGTACSAYSTSARLASQLQQRPLLGTRLSLVGTALAALRMATEAEQQQQGVLDALVQSAQQRDILFVLYHLKQLDARWINQRGELGDAVVHSCTPIKADLHVSYQTPRHTSARSKPLSRCLATAFGAASSCTSCCSPAQRHRVEVSRAQLQQARVIRASLAGSPGRRRKVSALSPS